MTTVTDPFLLSQNLWLHPATKLPGLKPSQRPRIAFLIFENLLNEHSETPSCTVCIVLSCKLSVLPLRNKMSSERFAAAALNFYHSFQTGKPRRE